jgi:hypothetical protein
MNNELDRIAKRHKGLGLLQANNSNKRKQSLDDLMTNSRLAFGLISLVAFVGFLLVITALQGLAVMLG